MSNSERTLAVGIDVGGTFTDIASVAANGTVKTAKVVTQSSNRTAGVVRSIESAKLQATEVHHIAHGTTVVTNLLLERQGAAVAACTTAGFTDILELRRQDRAALYDLARQHAPPPVSRERVFGVEERIGVEGVLIDLTEDECLKVANKLLQDVPQPEAIAICFIHSYADSSHEQQLRDVIVAEAAKRNVECEVVCSHEVLPEIREYERMATTVAEAYSRPAVRKYLGSLSAEVEKRGFPHPFVMTSAGGTVAAALASTQAASLALSGPAGGVTGAAAVLRSLDIQNALTIDIGGTSADVGLIVNGEPLIERGGGVGGIPISLPRVLVEAVAAGGGSVGWIDEGGAVRAGPQSAGSSPGPACYGAGGTLPTVTDAHVVLGNIAEGKWSDGVSIDARLAREAFIPLAKALQVTVERAAQAVIHTADATMARALRRVSVERGVDPRSSVLVAFGGGGPLHGCGLADQLGISRVIVPPFAGVLSAVGLAIAPKRTEAIVSVIAQLTDVTADIVGSWIAMANRQLDIRLEDTTTFNSTVSDSASYDSAAYDSASLDSAALDHALSVRNESDHDVRWWLRSRYVGQGHELDIPVFPGDDGAVVSLRFSDEHKARTGFTLNRPVECISIRASASGRQWPVHFRRSVRHAAHVNTDALETTIPIISDNGEELCYESNGPFIVHLPDATMYVAKSWKARTLAQGGWIMERLVP